MADTMGYYAYGRPTKAEYHEDVQNFNPIAENIANQLKGKAAEFNNVFNVTEANLDSGYVGKIKEMSLLGTEVSGFGETKFREVLGAGQNDIFIQGLLTLSPIIVDGKITWIDPLAKEEKKEDTTFHMPREEKHSLTFKVLLKTSPGKSDYIHSLSVEPLERPIVEPKVGCDTQMGPCRAAENFVGQKGWYDMPGMFAKRLERVLETITEIKK